MIYIGWIEEDEEEGSNSLMKILNLKDSLFTNCSSVIPGMKISQEEIPSTK